jgi:hypothetical protein
MSPKQKIEKEIEEATEKIIGLVPKSIKGEIAKQAIESDKNIQELVGETLTEKFGKPTK